MLFIPLLRKEVHWSKRNILVLGFILILVPASFGATSIIFQEAVPENVPVATLAQDENVSEEDMRTVEAILNLYTDPQRVDSREEGVKKLEREEVYALIQVPPNLRDGNPSTNGTFRLTIDGNIAPLLEAAPFIEELVQGRLNDTDQVEGNFTMQTEVIGIEHVGGERSLAEYLYPTFMMAMLIFFAFTYVPYNIARDAEVLDRLRVESTIESLVTAKLAYLTSLMVVPLLVFGLMATYFGYQVSPFSPIPLLLMLLTFLFLSTVSLTVMVLSRFSGAGQFANLLLMLGVLGASAIDFPRGLASSIRPQIAVLTPTHHIMIAIRSLMLKDLPVTDFTGKILFMLVATAVAVVALKVSIIYFRRTT